MAVHRAWLKVKALIGCVSNCIAQMFAPGCNSSLTALCTACVEANCPTCNQSQKQQTGSLNSFKLQAKHAA